MLLEIATQAEPGSAEFLTLPIHPVFVHFPIALLTIGWALVVWRHWRDRPHLDAFIMPALGVGVAFLPIVVVSGLRDADWVEFLLEPAWDDPLIWHVLAAIAAAVVFTVHFLRRRRWIDDGEIPARTDVNLVTGGMWLLLMTGLIAGEMVYR